MEDGVKGLNKHSGKFAFTTVAVILPSNRIFKHLLTDISSLCVWILHKEKLVGRTKVPFILFAYPVTVTCTSVSILDCSLLRTDMWGVCSILFILLFPQCKTRYFINDDVAEGSLQDESLYLFSTSSYFPVLSKFCWNHISICLEYSSVFSHPSGPSL